MPKGSRVIMVDDDKMLVDMYKERLELAGYNVVVSRNGEEGLAKVREEKPDIVLLDIMMPKINGYEALASLKSDPQTKDIPVIMLSALMRDFNREKAVEAGADDYLIKSEAMPSDVITKIEQVLQKYGKGTTPPPGSQSPNIPAPQATPPAPTPTPSSPPMPPATPPPSPETPPVVNPPVSPDRPTSILPQTNQAVTPPEQIIFEPAEKTEPPKPPETNKGIETEPKGMVSPPPAKPAAEEVPVVSIKPAQPSPTPPPPKITPQSAPIQTPTPAKSPASIALIVILVILLTALINDVIIYYFFFMKK
ncbi:hypothetical protein A2V71_01740 [Candidatus Berkelbacteria bacterium RBG_13_40_8]|uniref:Response regulatory domain-containing protein n=1 Tax=Candidatus Berkelbacteria bacterium RBG_13_40_8 TaxID=1797467 RepID=A0A1F5DPP2_9BACT|nr:MAG: hypothetical protein A2V71_01740 [Candidatus Berkelbacteria bacterium RBG_13_40_8]